jgi:hypothetical protein
MKRTMRTSEEMYPIVESYLERDQTQKAFCAERGLPLSVMTYWVAKYRREHRVETEAFVEIGGTGAAERPLMEVVYPRGVRLRFFAPVAPAYLELLLGA